MRIGILLLLLQSTYSYPYHQYARYTPMQPLHYLYRLPQLFQRFSMQNYLFNNVNDGGVTSQTSEMNAEAGRRSTSGNDLLKQYVYTLILVKLLTESEPPLSESRSENAPFQRTDTLPAPDTAAAMNDQPASETPPTEPPPSSTQTTTTEDYYANWVRVGSCRYQAVKPLNRQDYFHAKEDCASMGARLAAPGVIKDATDITSFSEQVGLKGIAYWVGVEEDSSGRDVSSDQEPQYSKNEPYPDQECLAVIAYPDAVLNSYMSCTRTAPAYVCQVC